MNRIYLARPSWILPLLAAAIVVVGCGKEPVEIADFGTAIGHYETIRVSLTEDSIETVESAAKSLVEVADQMARSADVGDAAVIVSQVSTAASKVAEASDIEAARSAFRGLSEAMIQWHAGMGEDATKVAHCPMAAASWLQPGDEEIGNPYYGSSMLRCGSFVASKDDPEPTLEAAPAPVDDAEGGSEES